MDTDWQNYFARWHICHSWQDAAKHSVSAMVTALLFLLALLMVAAIVGTIRLVATDGYRRVPTRPTAARRR
jgi:hypothetical protein